MKKTMIIMRGLPWTGKSYRANELANELGKNLEDGKVPLIFSTDEYWYKVNFPEKPEEYSFKIALLGAAHKWNQLRAQRAVDMGEPLIIIDNTNSVPAEAKPYVQYAVWQNYDIRIEEPTSDRWKEISELLCDKKSNKKSLKEWAYELAEGSKETHGVPFLTIDKMMRRWHVHMTVDDVLKATDLF